VNRSSGLLAALSLLGLLAGPLATPAAADGNAAIRYLALGDSYAYGVGAAAPASGGYVGRFTADLTAAAHTAVAALDLADPGATTADLVGDYAARGAAGTSQLARAVQLLASGGVNLATLDIGGNDILRLLAPGQTCAGAALSGDACLAAVQVALRANTTPNLPRILGALVAAAQPGATIIVLTYPNPYSLGMHDAVEQRTDQAVMALDTIILDAASGVQSAATARGVTVTPVDLFAPFAGRGGALTHILDADRDIHPNDAGYAVITAAVEAAYGGAGNTMPAATGQGRIVTRLGG
jgi:lysophospholipase L1-like esterase